MTKRAILVVMFLILIEFVCAATIHGTIYDLNLDKVNNARVMINTQPRQQHISKNGTYMFNVPVGEYNIIAKYYRGERLESYVEENISVKDDGDYVLDLILFPSFEEENELLEEEGIDLSDEYFKEKSYRGYYFFGFLLLSILIVLLVYLRIKKKPAEKIAEEIRTKSIRGDTLEDIIKVIKEEGGRTTQKEIRKKIPLSEAKISLMIAELEDKGIIKKIKKGRGNIIILNKKD